MVRIRIVVFILIYAIVVVLSMVTNTVLMVVRSEVAAKTRAEGLASISLGRVADTMNSFVETGEQNVERLRAQLESLGIYAYHLPRDSPLSAYEATLKALSLPQAYPSQLTQEEVWLSETGEEEDGEVEVTVEGCGCSRRDNTCYVYRNETCTVAEKNHNEYTISEKEGYPFLSFWLNAAILQSMTFSSTKVGMWSPVLRRYTNRSTTLVCEGRNYERLFAYYKCVELFPAGVKPKIKNYYPEPYTLMADRFPTNDTTVYPYFQKEQRYYCKHAVVSQVVQEYVDRISSFGLAPDSEIMQGSRYQMDSLFKESCDNPPEMVKEVEETVELLSESFKERTPSLTLGKVYFRDDTVTSVKLFSTQTGVTLGFNEWIPNDFFFRDVELDRNISIIILVLLCALTIAASVAFWWCTSIPLWRICRRIHKVVNENQSEEESMDQEVDYQELDEILVAPDTTREEKEVEGTNTNRSTITRKGSSSSGEEKKRKKSLRRNVKERKRPSLASNGRTIIAEGENSETGERRDTFPAPKDAHYCGIAVTEVLELHEAYEELCSALSDLRAFLPQELDMLAQRDGTLHHSEGEVGMEESSPLGHTRWASSTLENEPSKFYSTYTGNESLPTVSPYSSQFGESVRHTLAFAPHQSASSEPPHSNGSGEMLQVELVPTGGDSDELHRSGTSVRRPSTMGKENGLSLSERGESVYASLLNVIPVNGDGPGSVMAGSSTYDGFHSYSAPQCYRLRTKIEHTNITAIMLFLHCPVVNPDYLYTTMDQFLRVTMEHSIVFGGNVSSVRPDFVSVYFTGSNQSRNAVRYATRVLHSFPPNIRNNVRIVIDSCRMYLMQCSPYGKVFFGDRFEFMLNLCSYHDVGEGRILLTDRVAAECDSIELLLPTDNIIPRHGESAVLLFVLLDDVVKSPNLTKAIKRHKRAFFAAVKGSYEEALRILKQHPTVPPADERVAKHFLQALRQLLRSNPRRPRFCRFQLPTFESLGMEVQHRRHVKLHNQLDIVQLTMPIPTIDFFPSAGTTLQSTIASSFRNTTAEIKSFTSSEDDTLDVVQDSTGQRWFPISAPIGFGSFAEVYKVISAHGTICAIKCIRLNQINVEARDVVQEVNTSCGLFNDFIVNYTGWTQQGSRLILFMEYMPGGALNDILSNFPNGLLLSIARRYATHMLKGLDYLQKHNVVHADFKPQNVLLSSEGQCKVADFGSSINKANSAGQEGDVFNLRGTPLYMAPEVAAGDTPTTASDMWSFGVTLYEMLTGRLPWVWKDTNEPVFRQWDTCAQRGSSEGDRENDSGGKVSVKRFMQGVIRHTIGVQLEPLPEEACTTPTLQQHHNALRSLHKRSPAALELLSLCLSEDPNQRITAEIALLQHFITVDDQME